MGQANRRDFQDLTRIRLREARALAAGSHFDGAYYLAGYAVECGLKACIAKGTQRYEFPDRQRVERSYSHSLIELVKVADLEEARVDRAKIDALFRSNWDVARNWSEQSRYARHRPESAIALLSAVGDRYHGVISWIRLHW